MKRYKMFTHVFAFLSAIACIGFTGCNQSSQQGADSASAFAYACGFDDYEEISRITTSNFQGSMKVCKEKDFFTDGTSSLKLNVKKATSYDWHRYGETKDYLAPTLQIPISETDLGNTQAFTLDVYNDNDYDTGIYIYAKSNGDIIYSGYDVATKKKWNKLVFSVNTLFTNGVISDVYISVSDTNENTTYYFDSFAVVEGTTSLPNVSSSEKHILELKTAADISALQYFTKTDSPASHLSLAYDPVDSSKQVTGLIHENYTGRSNPLSYLKDDKEYGFSVWEKVLSRYDLSDVKKITLDVYNGMKTSKKIDLRVSDGENVASRQTEVPIGTWTTISVNYLVGLDLTSIKDITVSLNCYDNFEAGAIFFRNLSVEV